MIAALCNLQRAEHPKVEQMEDFAVLQRVEWGRMKVEQVAEALGVVEVVGLEVAGGHAEVVLRGQVMVDKPRLVGMILGEVARPCQSNSSSRGKAFGKWLLAAASGKTWTRRGRSRCSKRCATVSRRSASWSGVGEMAAPCMWGTRRTCRTTRGSCRRRMTNAGGMR